MNHDWKVEAGEHTDACTAVWVQQQLHNGLITHRQSEWSCATQETKWEMTLMKCDALWKIQLYII